MKLPTVPMHPEPMIMKWSKLEIDALRDYGIACARAALEAAAEIADKDHYGDWLAAAIRALEIET